MAIASLVNCRAYSFPSGPGEDPEQLPLAAGGRVSEQAAQSWNSEITSCSRLERDRGKVAWVWIVIPDLGVLLALLWTDCSYLVYDYEAASEGAVQLPSRFGVHLLSSIDSAQY
jgi:hypothetical protein